MRSIPSAPTLAPWSRTVGRPICWWSRATSRGWSRRSTGSDSRRLPPAHRAVDRGHGRIEQRTTWVAPAPPDLNFPHAAQVVIVQRHTTDLAGKHPHTELVYAVTCLTADQADAERLGALLPAHWCSSAFHELPRTPQTRSSRGPDPEALRTWVRQAEIDGGIRPGTTTEESRRIAELEKEVRELRRANEILKAASAYFARELDPRLPR